MYTHTRTKKSQWLDLREDRRAEAVGDALREVLELGPVPAQTMDALTM